MSEQTQNNPTGQPHPTQAPTVAPVPYEELQQHVTAERSVHRGTRAMVQGIRERLEQIAGEDRKDPTAVRNELRSFIGELNADTWARAVVDNTSAKHDVDPQSNPPQPTQINR